MLDINKPIPKIEDPLSWSNSSFTDSPFVEIITDENFFVELQYDVMGLKNAVKRCFVRKEVYDLLLKAAENLQAGYRLKLLDTWRPFALQEELYQSYSKEIIKIYKLENETEEKQKECIRKFVSEPIADVNIPPVHTTGGAVDLTIVDENNNELDMGTEFDSLKECASTAYFENEKISRDLSDIEKERNIKIRNNRRLLYNIMRAAGFTNLPSEWWHYDYGDRFYGYYNNVPSIYKGVFTENNLNI